MCWDQSIRIPIALAISGCIYENLLQKAIMENNGISVQCTSMREYARDITESQPRFSQYNGGKAESSSQLVRI